MKMNILCRVVLGCAALAGWTGWGQTHKVTDPESVVRAVGVYEWTGDLAKPKASRLIPVSLFIEGKLEQAGVYIARPVPFALLTGNVYELQESGIPKGTLELSYARHIQTADAAYDDGWFGYGIFHPPAVARKSATTLRASKTLPVIKSSSDDARGRPHLGDKTGEASTDSGSGSARTSTPTETNSGTPAADPDRPTMKRRGSSSDSDSKSGSDSSTGSASGQGTGTVPAEDPDRPTMKRHPSDSSKDSSGASGGTSAGAGTGPATASGTSRDGGSAGDPQEDVDRPTLKRRSPEDAKKAQRAKDDVATVTATGSLNDDPNRPNLHHGKPASAMTEEELPKLSGLPPDLHQMVAVSDAKDRDPHPFARPWSDDQEKAAILDKMQTMAREQLSTYGSTAVAKDASTTGRPAAAKPATASAARKSTASRSSKAAAPPPAPLLDEELKGYTLSYGGAPTYVYMAHSAGTGADLRYVTVVAQADALGQLKPAIQSVTDAAHLDRTPWMRLVDVVDVEASNRASLLFELRGQSSRQFGLYRVIAAKSEQIFLTGTTQ